MTSGTGKSVEKTRGATLSPAPRFLARESTPVDDGWHNAESAARWAESQAEFLPPHPATTLLPDRTVRLITRNKSPDINFDRSINAYKGCEHGCVYCFARPTHAYLDLSPGLDFETRIFFKTRVRANLEAELAARSYQCRTIAMGTNTDPYQPAERDKRITREILEILLEHRHPVSLVTKSQLILRDLDLISELARHQLINVHVSVTTLDNALKTRLEPRTAGPKARLKVINTLHQAGVPVGAMVAPVIPFINDAEIEDIVAACVGAGAQALGYILLRLPLEVAPMFHDWLNTHYPLKTERVENALRSARGGQLYRAAWGQRMVGSGAVAEMIASRFHKALKSHGLRDVRLAEPRTDLFAVPDPQQTLF